MKKIILITAIIASIATTIACSKKNDDNAMGGGTVAVTPACVNCIANLAGYLGTARTKSTYSLSLIEIAMDIYGDPARFNAQDLKAIIFYQGPVTATANMNVAQAAVCGLLAGNYVLNTLQAGNMAGGMLSGLKLAGTDPVGGRVEMTLIQQVLYNGQDANGTNTNSTTNRFYSTIQIDMVNGQPCGLPIYTY